MKYLSHYVQQAQTELFNSTGAFFAFNNEQFAEKKQPDTKYVQLGTGMLCPKVNADKLIKGLKTINADGIAADIKENGIDAIIQRELSNHEAHYTGDIESTCDALSDYPITVEQVQAGYRAYYQHCIDNDLF